MTDEVLTPKAQLIDLRLREAGHPGLLDYVAARRQAGATWTTIAAEIEDIAKLRVTDMGLRYWLTKAGEAA